MPRNHFINGVVVPFTAEEETARDAEEQAWADGAQARKLVAVKRLRLNCLRETDWMACSDVTMPTSTTTWRQQLRDLPQDNTTEAEYDLLLAIDADGNLTNAIWESK